jgi:FkbM family methyltransferase
MRAIFVDLGAYDGDSIKAFMRRRNLVTRPSEFDIYAFEPNPKFWLDLTALPYTNIVSIDNSAAWVEDGIFPFAIDETETPMGSTLMSGKINIWEKFDKVETRCFDFSGWLKQFKKKDYIIVKMDVEGAEREILNKMLQDGTASMMNELWVEMHPNKVVDFTTTEAQELKQKIIEAGVIVKDWH